MKKIFYSILLCLMMFCSMNLVACGKGKLVSVEVNEDTIKKVVLVNEELDLSNLKLNLTYENGKTEEVAKNNDVVVTGFDKQKVGNQTITISYKNFTVDVEIFVTADENETYEMRGFEKPDFYKLYEGHNDATGDTAHYVLGSSYKVGDDNPFVFLPEITSIKEVDGELPVDITLTRYTSNVQVEIKDEETGNYTLLTDNVDNYVVVDNENSTFDFVDGEDHATGRTFRITVSPKANEEMPSITFEVEVVNGWNVYNAKDLSRVDNCAKTAAAWATKKNGGYNEDIDAIVLHNNIELKVSDLPSEYFFFEGDADCTETNKGTMRVWKSMYTRDVPVGETFSIYGNYFKIDAAPNPEKLEEDPGLPLTIKRADDAYGHSAIFSFGGDNNNNPGTLQGNVYIENLKLVGNAQRSEEAKYEGGLTGINSTSSNIRLENCITRNFTTHIVTTEQTSTNDDNNNYVTIKNTKMIDSFSGLMYAARTKNVVFDHCLLKGSGGPTVMGTSHDPDGDGALECAYTNVTFKDTEIYAYVGGEEGWFKMNNALEVASRIKSLDALFVGVSTQLRTQLTGLIQSMDPAIVEALGLKANNVKSMHTKVEVTKDGVTEEINQLNFIDIIMPEGYNPDPESGEVNSSAKGGVIMKNAEGTVISAQDITTLTPLISVNAQLAMMPFFQSNGVLMTVTVDEKMSPNGMQVFDATNGSFITLQDAFADAMAQTPNLEKLNKFLQFFEGEYLHLYMGGDQLGATVQFYDVPSEQ